MKKFMLLCTISLFLGTGCTQGFKDGLQDSLNKEQSTETEKSDTVTEDEAQTNPPPAEDSKKVNTAETSKSEAAESNMPTPTSETHIYDNARIKDVMNGMRTKKTGEYSIIEISSAEVTIEALTDWYLNYVTQNSYNFCIILYTDKSDNTGVYAIQGLVQKDVKFTKDKNGDYSLRAEDATANAITYKITDGKLEELKPEE